MKIDAHGRIIAIQCRGGVPAPLLGNHSSQSMFLSKRMVDTEGRKQNGIVTSHQRAEAEKDGSSVDPDSVARGGDARLTR